MSSPSPHGDIHSPPSSRSVQRRSPVSNVAAAGSVTSRNSSSSIRNQSSGRRQVNLSTIEKSVTHLLVATKQLLETLTAWSRGQATEAEVSDVYVRLGSEFNIACRAFIAIGVETSDLGNVPDDLRTILESTLSQDASPASLDVYLPRIREIIINLLHGLKRKQSKLRQRQARDGDPGNSARASAVSQPDQPSRRNDSVDDGTAPPRSSSLPGSAANRASSTASQVPQSARASHMSARSHMSTISTSSSHSITSPTSPPSSDALQFQAAIPPQYFFPPPAPPEPKEDPLIALQRENALERRASRRYSAYQIAKLTGTSPNGVSLLQSQPAPTPRHRDPHDTLDTARVRTARSRPARSDVSPMRNNRISEERESEPDLKSPDSTIVQTPDDKVGAPTPPPKDDKPSKEPALRVDTRLDTPDRNVSQLSGVSNEALPSISKQEKKLEVQETPDLRHTTAGTDRNSAPMSMTIFLQIGRSIKKMVLTDGLDDLTIASLRLLFISKFNYNPPPGGDFPDIYLQDPTSGVRYELEDLRDIKDRSVICLNVEVLDEVKRHIDEGMEGLKKLVEGVKVTVETQGLSIQRVAERQEEAARKIAELSVTTSAPLAPVASLALASKNLDDVPANKGRDSIEEVREIRKDLAVLRQMYSSFVSDVNNSMANIKSKAASVKAVATTVAKPIAGSGRAYVEEGKKTLTTDADNLVNRVDDLQDTIEELRKDVVQRGVRPLPRQLESVSKELAQARQELKKMSDFIKREKPAWKKVWERELETVCEEQQFFNMQEELVTDLQDDLDKCGQTFTLVEQCTQQQFKPLRNASRNFQSTDEVDIGVAKDNMLNEVRALRPNHENRLEAIERAEKARQKELEGRVPEFHKELKNFVTENKLQKAGGFEEAERLRKARDEQIRKEIWEQTHGGGADPSVSANASTMSGSKLEAAQGNEPSP